MRCFGSALGPEAELNKKKGCPRSGEPRCNEGRPPVLATHPKPNHGATKSLLVALARLQIRQLRPLGRVTEQLPGRLQPSLGRLGAAWTHAGDAALGVFWGRFGGMFGASCATLETSWAGVGASRTERRKGRAQINGNPGFNANTFVAEGAITDLGQDEQRQTT